MPAQLIIPSVILYKAVIGLLVTGAGYLMTYPFRFIMKEWKALKSSLADVHSELTQQRSNHLEHIQAGGEKQVELLTKVCDTLDGVRLDLKEQTGFIQGLTLSPRRAKAYTKK
jgi:hypothetical protein